MINYSTYKRPKRNIHSLVIFLLVLFVIWLLFHERRSLPTNPNAKPRVVEARGDLASDEKNTIELFQNAAPSVVYITTIELRRSLFNLNIYEMPQGTGSGFVWDQDGRIVTNYHVIEGANRVEVTMSDGSEWKAVLVGTAPEKDVAVLQVSAPKNLLAPIPVGDSSSLLVGQKVFAIGNPFGLDHTLTSGIVSALGREIQSVNGRTIQGVIQTDAAINPGNSGGPLLDSAGRLIGVNTAIYSPSGSSAGIGFAVPVDIVNRVVPEIIKFGKAIRPGIGVSIANDRIAERLGLEGALIITVPPGSAAQKAGLKGTREMYGEYILGDIIIGVNGTPVKNYDELRNEFDKYKVGDEVILLLQRGKDAIELAVILEEVG